MANQPQANTSSFSRLWPELLPYPATHMHPQSHPLATHFLCQGLMTEQEEKNRKEEIRKTVILMRIIQFYLEKAGEYIMNSLKYTKSMLICVFVLWDDIFEGRKVWLIVSMTEAWDLMKFSSPRATHLFLATPNGTGIITTASQILFSTQNNLDPRKLESFVWGRNSTALDNAQWFLHSAFKKTYHCVSHLNSVLTQRKPCALRMGRIPFWAPFWLHSDAVRCPQKDAVNKRAQSFCIQLNCKSHKPDLLKCLWI